MLAIQKGFSTFSTIYRFYEKIIIRENFYHVSYYNVSYTTQGIGQFMQLQLHILSGVYSPCCFNLFIFDQSSVRHLCESFI